VNLIESKARRGSGLPENGRGTPARVRRCGEDEP